ncbi:MAG TPA: glycosyltransferase family 39 protein [Ktedonobacteraceae bacterium]|nr:glycosyltransferase family 39 protein [Ktedonobacteraceae bacterium]
MSRVDEAQDAQRTTSPEGTRRAGRTRTGRGVPVFLRNPRAHTLIAGLIVFGGALGFDLYRLGNPSVWFDEAFSVELAKQPLPLLWHIIWGPEPNMELYYLFLHGWVGLTGLFGWLPTEFVVRLPSAIFAALAAVMVFLLGRCFVGMAAGIAGAGLFMLNYLQLIYAQQARSYSLQLLLICLAWYALFAWLTTTGKGKRWWICFVLATTLAIYAQLFSMLILMAQVVAFGGLLVLPGPWRERARQRLRGFGAALAAIGVLGIPMGLVSLHGAKTNWLPIPQPNDILHLFQYITTNSPLFLMLLFLCCFCAVGIALLTILPEGKSVLQLVTFAGGENEQDESRLKQYFPVAFALVCWLFVPVIISYVVSQGSLRLFSSRYLVTILPPLFLLSGMAIAALRWRIVQVGLIAGVLLIAVYYVPIYYRSAQVEDWNSAVPWLEQHYQSGDGLVCFDNDVEQGCQIAVQYYLDAYPSAAHFTPDAPGAFSWEQFGPANPSNGTFAAVDPQALAAYAAQHPRFFYILGRFPDNTSAARAQSAQDWLDSHYHLLGRIHAPTVTISLYGSGT